MSLKHTIICGATASGKSSYALEQALKEDGVIINIDSRQIYKEVPLLAACPTADDLSKVPHELYQFLKGTEKFSAADYARRVAALLPQIEKAGKKAFFVGGTGLYIDTLLHGLSPVPTCNACVREDLKVKLASKGIAALYEELKLKDPVLADTLKPTDTQRILRGLEVFESTKRPLSDFHKLPKQKIIDRDFELVQITRPTDELNQRIEKRIDWMLANGAIEEVKALLALKYPAESPVLQSIGVREIEAYLKGEKTLDEARELMVIATRQYGKRQRTWFRGNKNC